jgi:hypothetical protein
MASRTVRFRGGRRSISFLCRAGVAASAWACALGVPAFAREPQHTTTPGAALECGYRSPREWNEAIRAAVARGEIRDPATRELPELPVTKAHAPAALSSSGCLSSAHVFPFEDQNQVLLTNFSDAQLVDLMIDAANALLAAHGDLYDFVGFWTNFDPHHTLGAAFYVAIANNVLGLGDPSTLGTPIFDHHAAVGLAGQKIQGFVMMHNVDSAYWEGGSAPGADFTRLAIAHEFEHRYATFLPNLLDGRRLQGDDVSCGRTFHWNWRVDSQGSAMELSEWVGANPATLQQSFVSFNTDTGGVWAYTDLYLMGYVSPAEMDAGNSELRYMNGSDCSAQHFGPITSFTSADIIASAGPRIPDSSASQKRFRTGWIMLHQPGDPPDAAALAKVISILQQRTLDWDFGTLGRGSMDDSLFDDCNCNGVADAADIAGGASSDTNGNGVPDECECSVAVYCTAKTNSLGCVPYVGAAGVPSASSPLPCNLSASRVLNQKSGLMFYGYSIAGAPFQGGTLCAQPPLQRLPLINSGGSANQDDCSGSYSVDFKQRIQSGVDPMLVPGAPVHAQFWSRDNGFAPPNNTGLTNAVRFVVQP